MKRSYWEDIAPKYEEEIFDVRKHDKKKKIEKALKKYSANAKSIIDIGCGVGKWLSFLSQLSLEVTGVDISQKNLDICQSTYTNLPVHYKRIDFCIPNIVEHTYNLALCVNAVLIADHQKRSIFFKNIASTVSENGYLLLVVPSLESKLWAEQLGYQLNIDRFRSITYQGQEAEKIANNIRQGVWDIDEEPTKHFLEQELDYTLHEIGFTIIKREKIEYDWSTEFFNPPKHLGAPYPFDWFFVAQKNTPQSVRGTIK